MRKTFLLVACIAATLCSIKADAYTPPKKYIPKVTVGVKVGVNLEQMTSSGPVVFSDAYKPGILGGLFLSIDKRKAGIRVEALVKSAKFQSAGVIDYKVNTLSLGIPVLYEHKLFKRVWFQVGPQFTSVIKANRKSSIGTQDYKGSLRNGDVSLAGGLEFIMPVRLTINARYIKGFVNVNNTGIGGTWNNSAIQVSVGYRFLN